MEQPGDFAQQQQDMIMTTLYDPKEHFDAAFVAFFEGPPVAIKVKPGQLGVNLDIFRQVKTHYRKSKENIACRVLADLCNDIQGSGYIGRLDNSALRIGTSKQTALRWRQRFAETGLLIPSGKYGEYSVDPKVAIRKDEKGNILEPGDDTSVFTF